MTDDAIKKESESTTAELDIRVAEKNMVVLFSCDAKVVKDENLLDNIQTRLRFMKITAKPDIAEIKNEISNAINNSVGITDLRLAEGVQPIKSVDGKIEWVRDFFKSGYYVDPETKKIDFLQKVSDPSVEKNELMVKVFRAKAGKNGRDVFGNAIIIPNPRDVNMKGGPNVLWDEEASGFRANCAGRVKFRGVTLEVNPVYIARNGVNTETGNIKHNGQVIVDGDIDSDLKVEATGDIEIRGLAYACDITSGGNLVAKEGINGGPEKTISVEGDILAKYIQNTNVISSGDITVNTEIYQCQVTTKGEVICSQGRITGGEIWATNGISVGEVGSKGNVETLLVTGIDKELQDKLRSNREETKRLKEMVKKLEAGYRKLKMNLQLLSNAQKESMVEIQYKADEGEKEINRIDEENKKIIEEIKQKSQAKIIISGIVYPGAVFRISDARYAVDQTLAGPICVFFDSLKGEISLTSKEDEEARAKEEELKEKLEEELRTKMEAELREKLEAESSGDKETT